MEVTAHRDAERENPREEILQATKVVDGEGGGSEKSQRKGWLW